jgi:hypothetical protein
MSRSFDGLPLTTFLGTSAISSFGKRLDPHPLSKVSPLVALPRLKPPRLCKFAVTRVLTHPRLCPYRRVREIPLNK